MKANAVSISVTLTRGPRQEDATFAGIAEQADTNTTPALITGHAVTRARLQNGHPRPTPSSRTRHLLLVCLPDYTSASAALTNHVRLHHLPHHDHEPREGNANVGRHYTRSPVRCTKQRRRGQLVGNVIQPIRDTL